MTLRLGSVPPRRLPDATQALARIRDPEVRDFIEEMRRWMEVRDKRVQEHLGEIGAAMAWLDMNDAVRFLSSGAYVEVRVPLRKTTLEKKPNKYVVIDQRGPGSVWRSRQSLVEGGNLVLMTDAPTGAYFEIVPFRLRPGRGRFDLEDAQPVPVETKEEDEKIKTKKGKKKPGGKGSWSD